MYLTLKIIEEEYQLKQSFINYNEKYYHSKLFKQSGFNSKTKINEAVNFLVCFKISPEWFKDKSKEEIIQSLQDEVCIEASI